MKVSIVILNWNGSGMLKRYLPVLLHHSDMADVEVVVADNNSSDDSVELVRRDFPTVRLICLDKNYGFAKGYNMALRQIESEYFVLLNSDVEVTRDWLMPLASYMDAHPDVAACQPKLRDWKNKEMLSFPVVLRQPSSLAV